MRRASRHLPAFVPAPVSWRWPLGAAVFFLLQLALFGYGLWQSPALAVWVVAPAVAFVIGQEIHSRRKLRALARVRDGESICTFVRALPVRELDTWVVRAVFEELQAYLSHVVPAFPVRPSDRLTDTLQIDAEDLESDLAERVAQRSGRTLDHAEANPYCGKVDTVEAFVRFLCEQPRRAA